MGNRVFSIAVLENPREGIFQSPLAGYFQDIEPQRAARIDLFVFADRRRHGQVHELAVQAADQQLGFTGHAGMNCVAPKKITKYAVICVGR